MAVDSKLKRFSASMLLSPQIPAMVPSGTIAAADRGAVSWVYAGITYGGVVIVDVVYGNRLTMGLGLNLIVWRA